MLIDTAMVFVQADLSPKYFLQIEDFLYLLGNDYRVYTGDRFETEKEIQLLYELSLQKAVNSNIG